MHREKLLQARWEGGVEELLSVVVVDVGCEGDRFFFLKLGSLHFFGSVIKRQGLCFVLFSISGCVGV